MRTLPGGKFVHDQNAGKAQARVLPRGTAGSHHMRQRTGSMRVPIGAASMTTRSRGNGANSVNYPDKQGTTETRILLLSGGGKKTQKLSPS